MGFDLRCFLKWRCALATTEKKKVAEFLPGSDKEMTTLLLDERARSLKNQMFECIQTHRECLQNSPLSAEKFRQPNSYDFSRPPQAGKLYYENFDDSMTSEEWQARAREALSDLFPGRSGSEKKSTKDSAADSVG